MMRIQILLFLITSLAIPLTAEAQRQSSRSGKDELRVRRSPVELLLGNRTELGLSAAQVSALEEIEARVDSLNRPLVARLVEVRRGARGEPRPKRGTPEHREASRRRMAEARPLMQQVRKNNHAAMHEVGEVLTPDQKHRVKQLIEERKERERNDPRTQRRRHRG